MDISKANYGILIKYANARDIMGNTKKTIFNIIFGYNRYK